MKFRIISILFIIVFMSCKESTEKKLVGTWEITEFRVEQPERGSHKTESELKRAGAFWDIKFSKNGDFQQDFNIQNPDKEKKTENGSWQIENNLLHIVLKNDTREVKMTYNFEIEGKDLKLILGPSDSPGKLVSSFRKK